MYKIFFIINCFSKGGGAEALLTKIVNNLNPEKYEIGIMEIIHDTVKTEPTEKRIKLYPYYVTANDPERKHKMYYVYHEWDKVIDEYIPKDYDLYVSFNYLKPSFLLPPGKKNIAWIHGDVYNLGTVNKKEERELQNQAFYKADRIVAISDITTQSLIDLFPEHREKIRVIYNGIDLKDVREKAKESTDVQLRHPALLSIGRLDENKNPLRLLDIFEQVHIKNMNTHLYYLGYGVLEKEVRRLAEERGLSGYVHLLGYYSNPFPIVAQADVCCMFSHSEGFPMALLEAVALDKPFVSSVIGGARILANGQRCGKTVETNMKAVDAIMNMLQADEKQIKEECRKSVKRFGLHNFICQIEEMFDELLEGSEKIESELSRQER